MRFLILTLTLLFLGVSSTPAYSQAALGLGATGIWQSFDSVDCNAGDSTITYSMFVVNNGTSSFEGTILIQGLYNSDTNIYVLGDMEFTPGDPLPAEDSVFISVVDEVRAPYIGGDNIIVVWPQALLQPFVQTTDSGIVELWVVNCPVSVEPKLILQNRFSYWPNPSSEALNYKVNEDLEKFEGVRIIDLNGKVVSESKQPLARITLDNFENGLYLLEVRFNDGIRGTFKIIKY